MTDNTHPEALRLADMLTADEWPGHVTLVSYARECVAELRRQHARITELEAQLEAIGAGEVNGPLMGRAVDHFPDVTKMVSRWYVLNKDGMADTEVREALAAPAAGAVAGPSEAVAYLDIGTGGYLDLGTDLADEALSRLPKGRHALIIAGTYGIDGYTPTPPAQVADSVLAISAEPAGAVYAELPMQFACSGVFPVYSADQMRAFADATHAIRASHGQAPAQAAPAGVLEDAARWHWMAEYIVGTRTDLDDELIASATVDELRKLVDADRAARSPAISAEPAVQEQQP